MVVDEEREASYLLEMIDDSFGLKKSQFLPTFKERSISFLQVNLDTLIRLLFFWRRT